MNSDLHDSPFSDYHTNPSSSPQQYIDTNKAQEHYYAETPSRRRRRTFSPVPYTPTPVQLDLLYQIHDIGKIIVKTTMTPEIVRWLEDRLDVIEAYLCAPEIQTRQPIEMEDSGMFMDDEEEQDTIVQDETGGLGLGKEVMDVFNSPEKDNAERKDSPHDTSTSIQHPKESEAKWEEDTTLGDIEVGSEEQNITSSAEPSEQQTSSFHAGKQAQDSEQPAVTQNSSIEDQVRKMAGEFQRVTADLQTRFDEVKVTLSDLLFKLLSNASHSS